EWNVLSLEVIQATGDRRQREPQRAVQPGNEVNPVRGSAETRQRAGRTRREPIREHVGGRSTRLVRGYPEPHSRALVDRRAKVEPPLFRRAGEHAAGPPAAGPAVVARVRATRVGEPTTTRDRHPVDSTDQAN